MSEIFVMCSLALFSLLALNLNFSMSTCPLQVLCCTTDGSAAQPAPQSHCATPTATRLKVLYGGRRAQKDTRRDAPLLHSQAPPTRGWCSSCVARRGVSLLLRILASTLGSGARTQDSQVSWDEASHGKERSLTGIIDLLRSICSYGLSTRVFRSRISCNGYRHG